VPPQDVAGHSPVREVVGQPAVDVVHRIDHYSTVLTVVVVLVMIGVQTRRRRRVLR
jgi:hypothetical protein